MAFTCKAYEITRAVAAPWVRNPATWQLWGSNDDFATHDVLDTQTDYVFAGVTEEFVIANLSPYQAYRLDITGMYPGDAAPALAAVRLLDGAGGADLTETMTSNVLPSPVVASASYEHDTEGFDDMAFCAFDADAGTYWMTDAGHPFSASGSHEWLQYDTGVLPPPPPLTVTAIDPASADNSGIASVTITGTGFLTDCNVRLELTGEVDIPASNIYLNSSTEITCNFDLTNVTVGDWDVTVTNPDDATDTLSAGFEVTVVPVVLTITSIDPVWSYQNRMAFCTLTGTLFEAGDTVELCKGSHVIPATELTVVSDTEITCMFNISYVDVGLWDVTVSLASPFETASLVRGFEVKKDPRNGIYLNDLSINDGDIYAAMLTGWSPKIADLRMTMSDPSLADGQTFIPGTKKDENQDLPLEIKVMGATKADLNKNLGLLLQELRKNSILVSVYPVDTSLPAYFWDAFPSKQILNDPYWQVEYQRANIAVVSATLNAKPGPRLDWFNLGHGMYLAQGTGVNDSFERGLDGWVVTGTGTVTQTSGHYAPDGGGFSARLENGNGEVCILTDEVARPINPLHHHNLQVGVLEVGADISVSVDAECFDIDGTSLDTLNLLLPWNPTGNPDWNDAMLFPFNYAGTDRYGKAVINPEDFPVGTVSLKLTITSGVGGAANAACIDAIWFGDTEYLKPVGYQYSGVSAFNIPAGVIPGDCAVPGDLYFSNPDIPQPWSMYDAGDYQWRDICGADGTHMWCCGLGGKIIFGDGTTWVPQSSSTREWLYGVTSSDSSHVWACGHNTLLFFNGSTWAKQTFPSLTDLVVDGSMEDWNDAHHLTHWNFTSTYFATLKQADGYDYQRSARIQFPADAHPVIQNAGFEIVSGNGWSNWNRASSGGCLIKDDVREDMNEAHSGGHSAAFFFGAGFWVGPDSNAPGAGSVTSSRIGVNPNGTFTVKVQTLIAPVGIQGGSVFQGSKWIEIKAYNAAGTYITNKLSGGLNAGVYWDWSEQTYSFVLPSNTASITIGLHALNPNKYELHESCLSWDDVSISFTPTPAVGTLTTKAVDLIAIDDQQNYTAAFAVRGVGGRWSWAKVLFYNIDKSPIGYHYIKTLVAASTSWTEFYHVLSPADYPVGTVYAGVQFQAWDTNSWASRYVEFDKVSLRLSSPNIKSIHAISDSLIYAVGEWGTILTEPTGTGTWHQNTSGVTVDLNAVHAFDNQHIIAVGDDGTILTNPGTDVWTKRVTHTTRDLNDVVVVPAGAAYAVGDNGTVLYSESFGSAWTTLPRLAGNLYSVCAVETVSPAGTIVFIVGDNGRIYSNESGAFTSIGQAGRGTLRGIYMSDETHGWICGDDGALYGGINDVSYLNLTNIIVGQALDYDDLYSPIVAAGNDESLYVRRLGVYESVGSQGTVDFIFNAKAHKGQHLPTISAMLDGAGSGLFKLQGQLKTTGGDVLTPLNAGQEADLGITGSDKFHEMALASGARTRWDPIDIPSHWTSPSADLSRINEILKVSVPLIEGAGPAGMDCLVLIPIDRSYCEVWNIATTPTVIFDSHGHNVLYSADGTIEAAAVLPSTQTLQTPKIMADPLGMNFVIGAWNVDDDDEQLTPRPNIRLMFRPRFLAGPHD